jgi:hypothetical protein
MTANRDFKRLVRDRQSRTGESYLTALRHVLAQRPGELPSVIPTAEFIEVSGVAAKLGLKCRMTVSPALVHEIDVDATVQRFRDLLLGAPSDPSLNMLRRMALIGEPAVIRGIHVIERTAGGFQENRYPWQTLAVAAVRRAVAGKTEPARPQDPEDGEDGDEHVVVFSPWPVPVLPGSTRPPLIIVTPLDDVYPDPAELHRLELERLPVRRTGR